MSGHSKWNNIKGRKEKSDAQRGKIFTKLGREIAVCVKAGGADPSSNAKLKDLIEKARKANMPNDNISRSIKKASGELGSINYEEITYEGYGIGGSAVVVRCLTDNKNRTAGDVRHFFDKFGGSMGATGCVSYMFDTRGVITIIKDVNTDVDEVMMAALEAGAIDVVDEEDCIEVITNPADLHTCKQALSAYEIDEAQVREIPQNYVVLDQQKLATFQRMIDSIEDLDDVQEVFHNVDMPFAEFED